MIDVRVKKLFNEAKLPTYGSEKAACADLYAHIPEGEFVVEAHTTLKIGTGMAFQPPKGYCGLIFARSGMATKRGLRPANCVGVCDEDYTGEYIVPIHNDTDYEVVVKNGERIAQLLFVPYAQSNFMVVDELKETERGDGGFGSTDEN